MYATCFCKNAQKSIFMIMIKFLIYCKFFVLFIIINDIMHVCGKLSCSSKESRQRLSNILGITVFTVDYSSLLILLKTNKYIDMANPGKKVSGTWYFLFEYIFLIAWMEKNYIVNDL